MRTTRSNFIKTSAIAGGAITMGMLSAPAAHEQPKPMRILILGGTGITGPFQVR